MFDSSQDRQQSAPPVQPVDPPAKVWVNLRRLFPVHPDDPHRRCNGLEVSRDVAGLVTEWTRSSTGARLGLVTYQLTTRDEAWSVTVRHYVPDHLLKRRGYRERREER
jgi:hypothetical protein